MTRPTARVLALLEILQAGGTRTVGELAVRLAVDERTVRRYVAHLADLDVPVADARCCTDRSAFATTVAACGGRWR